MYLVNWRASEITLMTPKMYPRPNMIHTMIPIWRHAIGSGLNQSQTMLHYNDLLACHWLWALPITSHVTVSSPNKQSFSNWSSEGTKFATNLATNLISTITKRNLLFSRCKYFSFRFCTGIRIHVSRADPKRVSERRWDEKLAWYIILAVWLVSSWSTSRPVQERSSLYFNPNPKIR